MTTCPSDLRGADDLVDIRQLVDLGTEEAWADLWTRHQLAPGEGVDLLARQARPVAFPEPDSPPAHKRSYRRRRAA